MKEAREFVPVAGCERGVSRGPGAHVNEDEAFCRVDGNRLDPFKPQVGLVFASNSKARLIAL